MGTDGMDTALVVLAACLVVVLFVRWLVNRKPDTRDPHELRRDMDWERYHREQRRKK